MKLYFFISVILFSISAGAQSVRVADPGLATLLSEERGKLPNPGKPFFDTSDFANIPFRSSKNADMRVVDVTGQTFTKALRVEVLEKPQAFHTVQVACSNNTSEVKKDDVLFIAFSARCLKSTDDTHEGFVGASLVLNTNTWSSPGGASGSFGSEWKRIYGYAVARGDTPVGGMRLHLFLSHRWQTVEIGGLNILNLGPVDPKSLPANVITYDGRDAGAPWRRLAEDRIEKIRKGDLNIILVDQSEKPVVGAQVHIAMTRHAYAFGCYAENPIVQTGEDAENYRIWFKKLFNKGVAPLFWGPGNATSMSNRYGWENPRFRKEYIAIARWLSENHIAVHGHCLVWPAFGYMPPEVRELSNDIQALKKRITAHIQDKMAAVAPYVGEWQVVNEPWGSREILNLCGEVTMLEWFKTARALTPNAKLFLNDNSAGGTFQEGEDFYFSTMQNLVKTGAPVDGIGWQCHYGSELVAPARLLKIIDRFAVFDKEIVATELTVNLNDENVQADYTRDFYTAFFSHPATSGILTWGFWEGRHYDPKAALMRKDWSFKPNGAAYTNLVFGKWWTDVRGGTESDGKFLVRGFLGDYEVSAAKNGKTKTVPIKLVQAGTTIKIVLD